MAITVLGHNMANSKPCGVVRITQRSAMLALKKIVAVALYRGCERKAMA